jgi:hypothetical protein
MLLRREMDEELVIGVQDRPASGLRSEVLESLIELNGQCLELLAEQALAPPSQGNLLLRQVGDIWRTLDSSARIRAATCPYLLVDAGFSDAARWRWAGSQYIGDATRVAYIAFFTVPRALTVARQVFIYAWHLARSNSAAAQLLLGMPAHCTQLISACTLPQIHDLAERYPDWLRPRWPNRVKVWRELLLAAGSGEIVALESARMHGLQLLAADSRNASLQIIKSAGIGSGYAMRGISDQA